MEYPEVSNNQDFQVLGEPGSLLNHTVLSRIVRQVNIPDCERLDLCHHGLGAFII